jgi:hypothetical protein
MLTKTLFAATTIASASAVTINIPDDYHVQATMTMPYYNLVEPITAYFSSSMGLGRLDYWGGVERYLYNSSGQGYQIVPTAMDGISSQETCFMTSMNEDPVSVFPDVTYFPSTPDEGDCDVNGVACEAYTLISPEYNETTGFDGNYTLKVDATTGIPLRFHFTGFNVVLGSHYDEYIFDYMKVDTSVDNAAVFTVPAQMTCTQLETDDDDSGGPTLLKEAEEAAQSLLKKFNKKRPHNFIQRHEHDLDHLLPRDTFGLHNNIEAKKNRFEAWAFKHGKKYASDEESKDRATLFHATEMYVNAMNRQHLSYWLGLNHMADWTVSEKAKLRGRKHTPIGYTVDATKTHEMMGGADDDVDWRDAGAVTPPKDQGSCGSCWSFGATGTTEGQLFLKTGVLTPLSQQNLMDCSWSEGNDACDGGLDTKGYEWMLKHNGGLATESSYPYMNADGYCRFDSSRIGATIQGYANITNGVDGLNDALANIGPISVSVDAAPDSFYYYQGGLYYSDDCLSGMNDLDHTVLAVGYVTEDDGQRYTIVKNSWSNHWGDEGFIYISQKNNCCGVATQPTYTILA